MTSLVWTPKLVEERLAEAAAVLQRLPAPRRQGYFNTWPRPSYEFSDLVGQDETVFWDRSRWQALCASCHGRKTASSDGGFGNARRYSQPPPGESKSLTISMT